MEGVMCVDSGLFPIDNLDKRCQTKQEMRSDMSSTSTWIVGSLLASLLLYCDPNSVKGYANKDNF